MDGRSEINTEIGFTFLQINKMAHLNVLPDVWYGIGGYKVILTDRGNKRYAKIFPKKEKDFSVPLMMLDAPTKPELLRKIKRLCENSSNKVCRFRACIKDNEAKKTKNPKKIEPKKMDKVEKKMKKVEKVKDVKVVEDFCIYPSDITELKTI